MLAIAGTFLRVGRVDTHQQSKKQLRIGVECKLMTSSDGLCNPYVGSKDWLHWIS